MNRVLRSPEISDKPFVISARTAEHSVTVEDDDEDAPQGHDPAEEGETGTSDPETPGLSENDSDAATDGDPSKEAGDDSASEDTQDDAGTGSDKADGTSSTETAESGPEGSEGRSEPSEAGIAKEEGEIMIGLEEVAERDAATAAALGDKPADTDGAAEQLPASASEIESIVEARLKEFEERFQQEKEDAYHAGFEDGTTEGKKQGLNQSEDEVARFQNLVDTLSSQWKDTLRTYDTAVADLTIKIAQKIIDVEVDRNQDAVLQAVHDCLAYVEDKTKVIIRVNPDDIEAVRRHRNDWLESLESIDHLLIEAEPSVTRGGCVVETPIGDVDAQIEERLERLRRALLEEINRNDDTQDA